MANSAVLPPALLMQDCRTGLALDAVLDQRSGRISARLRGQTVLGAQERVVGGGIAVEDLYANEEIEFVNDASVGSVAQRRPA